MKGSVTNIKLMYTGAENYEALIFFNFIDQNGKKGKSQETSRSFVRNYLD